MAKMRLMPLSSWAAEIYSTIIVCLGVCVCVLFLLPSFSSQAESMGASGSSYYYNYITHFPSSGAHNVRVELPLKQLPAFFLFAIYSRCGLRSETTQPAASDNQQVEKVKKERDHLSQNRPKRVVESVFVRVKQVKLTHMVS